MIGDSGRKSILEKPPKTTTYLLLAAKTALTAQTGSLKKHNNKPQII